MANNIKGITIEIGGDTSPLDKALKGVNKTSRDLQSELKEVNRQLKLDPTNTTLLEQKQKLLAESITNTNDKLLKLKDAEKQVQVQFEQGKVSEEQYRALQREITKTEQQLKTLENQASKSSVALNKIKNAADNVGDAAGKVSSTMAPATAIILGVGAASTKMGSDLIESTNKVEVAFKENAKVIEDWSKTTLDKYGIASGTALDMAATYGDMATSMGLTTKSAAEMGQQIVGRAADLSSFKNISIDVAKTALNGIFTGETESLKTLGVVMTQANLQQYAYSQGIKTKIQDMSQAEQVQLRYNYVMEATKNAEGDFARTADGAANSTRNASESIKEASSSLGVLLAPIVAKAMQYVANLAKSFIGLDDGTKKIILTILAVIAAISPIAKLIQEITVVVKGLAIALEFLMANPIVLLIAAIVAAIVLLVIGIKKLWDTNEGFRNAVINIWNGIKDFFQNAVETIKNVVITAFNFIKDNLGIILPVIATLILGPIGGVIAYIATHFEEVKDTIVNVFNAIVNWLSDLPGTLYNLAVNIFTYMRNGVVNTISSVADTIVNGIQAAVNFLVSLPGQALRWGEDFIDGLINGIKNKMGAVVDAVKGVGDKIRSYLHFSVPDEGPLTDYETWMPDFMSGLAKGIEQSKSIVTNAIKNLSGGIKVGMSLKAGAVLGSGTGTNNTVNNSAVDNSTLLDAINNLAYSIQNHESVFKVNDRELARAAGPAILDELSALADR
ncbi:hypothetical protein [Rhodopseudomonas parapalustris]